MREDQVLSSHSFYGFNKNVFFYNIIKPKLKTIEYNVRPFKNLTILGKTKGLKKIVSPVMQRVKPTKRFCVSLGTKWSKRYRPFETGKNDRGEIKINVHIIIKFLE